MTIDLLGSMSTPSVFGSALLKMCRAALSNTEKRCKVVEVKVLGLIRSNECQMVGIARLAPGRCGLWSC
jgi:hypothetical protein